MSHSKSVLLEPFQFESRGVMLRAGLDKVENKADETRTKTRFCKEIHLDLFYNN
jgi:hypothetical protein